MNPKIIFSFIVGLGLGLLIGYMATDLHYRKHELSHAQTQGAPQGGPMTDPHAMDNIRQTIQSMEELLKGDPNNYEALVKLGNLYYDAAKFDKAIEFYSRAVEIDNSDPNVLTDLGTSYRNTGSLEKAIEQYDQAHEKDPTHIHAIYNAMVVSLYDLKDKERARFYYDKVKAIAPPDMNLGQVETDLGIR